MKKSLLSLLLSGLLLLPALDAATRKVPARLREFTGRVVKVTDGDSIEVEKVAVARVSDP